MKKQPTTNQINKKRRRKRRKRETKDRGKVGDKKKYQKKWRRSRKRRRKRRKRRGKKKKILIRWWNVLKELSIEGVQFTRPQVSREKNLIGREQNWQIRHQLRLVFALDVMQWQQTNRLFGSFSLNPTHTAFYLFLSLFLLNQSKVQMYLISTTFRTRCHATVVSRLLTVLILIYTINGPTVKQWSAI